MNHHTSTPLVTVVIPTYNQADYLPACIDHCLFQSYENLELIIVDGGSTDHTKEYLNSLMEEIENMTMEPIHYLDCNGEIIRKKIITRPQNRQIKMVMFDEDIGATRTYNEGLKRASGEYCTYIVGDDIPHPHMIEELACSLEAEKVDFVYSDMNLVNHEGRIMRVIQTPDYSFEACLARWYHLGVSHLYRTDLHKEVGLMDESYESANDYDHYLRFAMAGVKFYHLPKVLYSIRHHDETRQSGQHTSERYGNLIRESKRCAIRAREWQQKQIGMRKFEH